MAISVSALLDLLSGALIILVGAFVLKAKPRSSLHRLFCAFAVADGVSTIAFTIAMTPSTTEVQLHALLVYYHTFFAFMTLALVLALSFPRPILPPRWRVAGTTAVGVAGIIVILWHAVDPYAFWTGRQTPAGVVFAAARGAQILIATWLAILTFITLRLTRLFRTEPSASHRLQASVVLGGMALAYTPYATTTFVEIFQRGVNRTVLHPDPGVGTIYLASGAVVLALAIAAVTVIVSRKNEDGRERGFLLKCFGGVLLLTIPTLLFPGRTASAFLQQLGLVAWPFLLAYAIARYEILDIGAAVRRTAAVSLGMTVLTVAFFIAEALLENALQATFAGALGTPIVAVLIAGALTALVSAPISALAKRISKRVAPEIVGEARRARQLEIYRHGLDAVLADGEVSVSENRVLASLRATLGVTQDDHARILAELEGRYRRPRTASA